jgi:hypothetical protein
MKTRHAQKRCMSHGGPQCRRRGAHAYGPFEGFQDGDRIIPEDQLNQRVFAPPGAGAAPALGVQRREFVAGGPYQRGQIDGMAPGIQFLATSGCGHALYQARQHLGGMLPADVIEQLKGLIGEVYDVPAV